MPLPEPRTGETVEFSVHQYAGSAGTLGDPEKILWSSIRQFCARDRAAVLLSALHGIKNDNIKKQIAGNISTYIRHAEEFYLAGSAAGPTTSPLYYYYSFLNLAKARCEIIRPAFHRRKECYRHGLSWSPNPKLLVTLGTEKVRLAARGVWHVLWEAITTRPCPAINPTDVRLRELFAYCPEVSIENEITFLGRQRLLDFEPEIFYDDETRECWLRFSVSKDELSELRLSRNAFLQLPNFGGRPYRQVICDKEDSWCFEIEQTLVMPRRGDPFRGMRPIVRELNLFHHLGDGKVLYSFADQRRLPFNIPQILVYYSIVFWLDHLFDTTHTASKIFKKKFRGC